MSHEPNPRLVGRAARDGFRCPRCGCSTLVNDEGHRWCTYVGGVTSSACAWGCEWDVLQPEGCAAPLDLGTPPGLSWLQGGDEGDEGVGVGRHRKALDRVWDENRPPLVWVMLNPSTADGREDDPTIRRCIGFSKLWGYGSLVVLNLYSYRATDPAQLWDAVRAGKQVVGDGFDAETFGRLADGLPRYVRHQPVVNVVLGWGAVSKLAAPRVAEVLGMLGWKPDAGGRVVDLSGRRPRILLLCVGTTKDGQPRHPLYAPYAAPQVYTPPIRRTP